MSESSLSWFSLEYEQEIAARVTNASVSHTRVDHFPLKCQKLDQQIIKNHITTKESILSLSAFLLICTLDCIVKLSYRDMKMSW